MCIYLFFTLLFTLLFKSGITYLYTLYFQTGTLTEDGLDMWGVVPVHNSKFHLPIRKIQSLPTNEHFLKAMVTCHGITMIEGNLVGDPLDIKVLLTPLFYSLHFVLCLT